MNLHLGPYVGELRVADLSNNNGNLSPILRAIAGQRRRRVNPIVGVIFKISESTGFVDTHAPAGIALARKLGLLVGGYHFFHPTESASAQAELFVRAAHGCGLWAPGDFRPVLDYEIGADGHESPKRDAFYAKVRELTGHGSLLYTGGYFNPVWLPPRDHASRDWWAAGYPSYHQPRGLPAPVLHQFASSFNVGGYRIDMSRVIGGRGALINRLVCHTKG